MNKIYEAAKYAAACHRNQVYGGEEMGTVAEPYINHPSRVAARVMTYCVTHDLGHIATTDLVAAAWLHDVVEDCGVTLAEIERRFGRSVSRFVDGVSRREGEGYMWFVARASKVPGTKLIKRQDVLENQSRLPADRKLHKRYTSALEVLA